MSEKNKTNITEFSKISDGSEVNIEAWWLDASSTDDKWKLKNMVPGASASYYTVGWLPMVDELTPVSSIKWKRWKNYVKRLAYFIIESDKTNVNKTSSLALYCREIRALAEWLCFSCRLNGVEDITKQHVSAYEDRLSSFGLTVGSVEVKLSIFTYMYLFRDEIGAGLNFSPYIGGLRGSAKRIGKKGAHTKTIFPNEFLGLIDYSIQNVDNSKKILDMLHCYLYYNKNLGDARLSRLFKRNHGIGTMEFKQQVRVLYASAIVIILSLTAMRKHEASSITYEDALNSIDSEGYLTGKVHKTAGTETGRKTSRPVPQEVIDAVSVIVALTKERRSISKNKSTLLLKLPFDYGTKEGNSVDECINTSSLYGLLNTLNKRAGFEWKLRPHMLRRAFSMMWAWRFEIGDLEYLSNILFHNNYLYTLSYVEDEDVLEFLDDEVREYTYDYFENIFLGNISVAGGISSTISKYKRIFRSRFNVVTPDRVAVFVENIIDRHSYRVIPNADGFCFISSGRGSRAKCSTDGRTENYTNRSEETCTKCPNFGVDKSRKEYWKKRLDAHGKVLSYYKSGMMYDAAKEGMKSAENIIRLIDIGG
jgi:integrase